MCSELRNGRSFSEDGMEWLESSEVKWVESHGQVSCLHGSKKERKRSHFSDVPGNGCGWIYFVCVCQNSASTSQPALPQRFSQTVIPTLVIAQWLRAQILGIECSWDLCSGESTQGAPATQWDACPACCGQEYLLLLWFPIGTYNSPKAPPIMVTQQGPKTFKGFYYPAPSHPTTMTNTFRWSRSTLGTCPHSFGDIKVLPWLMVSSPGLVVPQAWPLPSLPHLFPSVQLALPMWSYSAVQVAQVTLSPPKVPPHPRPTPHLLSLYFDQLTRSITENVERGGEGQK